MLLQFLDLLFNELIFLCLFIELAVQFESLLPEDDHFLFEILDSIVGGKHAFLFL